MTIKKTLVFLVILSFLGSALSVSAAAEESNNRYFVKSNSNIWKKSFVARHSFDNGFTADLSDFQLRVAKIFNVDIEPVKKLSILPSATVAPAAAPKGKPSSPRPTPSVQVPWGIKSVYSSASFTPSGGNGVKVAVLDTGVNKSHPDLKNRITECKDFSSAKQPIIDNSCDDKNGHGTHVSGIIAADGGNDHLGIYGVAPEANLLEYKVCGANGSCWSDDIAMAIRTAADNHANIINMSLGSESESSLIADAISYASDHGVLIVAAAGNDGPDAGTIDYPGANVHVAAVAAMDINKNIADWSSRGLNESTEAYVKQEKDVDFAAPGVNIESTSKDGGYIVYSGTSMASPHAAGLAAKLWLGSSENPAQATLDLLHNLSKLKDILPTGDDNASGWGMLGL